MLSLMEHQQSAMDDLYTELELADATVETLTRQRHAAEEKEKLRRRQSSKQMVIDSA